jgi:hypothetical protein
MRLSPLLLRHLAETLHRDLAAASLGHCVRVDYLTLEDAEDVCRHVRALTVSGDVRAHVLEANGVDPTLTISTEQAVELRNRKTCRLGLLVPAGLVDATASSLTNAFAGFDLDGCFADAAAAFVSALPDDVSHVVREVLGALRGSLRPTAEAKADYAGAVLQEPSITRAGIEMWRVGLIPDAGVDGIVERLENNRRCVQALVRPPRPQTSPAERLAEIGLRRGAVYDELLQFFGRARLRDARSWLSDLADPTRAGRLTFDRWAFEALGGSDLERIDVQPLLDDEGRVESFTKLQQPGGPGTPPLGPVGTKVTVKWNPFPASPGNIARWRVEVVPSRQEYAPEEAASFEPPTAATSARNRKASVKLDVELTASEVRAVQFRVIALDEHGAPIAREGDQVIEGLSQEFWLTDDQIEQPEPRQRRDTVPTLPFGRVKALIDEPADALVETPGQWVEADLHYFGFTINGHRMIRIGLSPVLRAIEKRCLAAPDELGAYRAHAEAQAALDPNSLAVRGSTLSSLEASRSFLAKRRDIFKQIVAQDYRGLIETAEWTPELSRSVRAYARAYRELLDSLPPEHVLEALSIDTLHVTIDHAHTRERAALVLPTHPLRLLWYSAYADLLGGWTYDLTGAQEDARPPVDLALLERVTPLNCPAFALGDGREPLLAVQNLRMFWGVAVPLQTRDPARLVADVARVVGLGDEEATLADLPPSRLASELTTYRDMHPYTTAMRLNVVNPGSGAFVAAALREFLTPTLSPDDDADSNGSDPTRMELVTEAYEASHPSFSALIDLQRDLYEAQPRGRRTHLNPLFALAMRPIGRDDEAPRRDANLSIVIDQLRPTVGTGTPGATEDSASFYGLLVRLLPEFASDERGSLWRYRVNLPTETTRERHPGTPAYTNELVDTHRSLLLALGRGISGTPEPALPEIEVRVDPEDRLRIDRLHSRSDWVITLDRFFGVEYFDDPRDPDLARVARKYLLDYAPEFLDGLGHRMLVTTTHRGEVEELLQRAMVDLGFEGPPTGAASEILEHLKAISGRLALEVLGDDSRAREAVALGAAAAWLRATGELNDSIVVPVAAHPDLLSASKRARRSGSEQPRCDLVRIQFSRNRTVATFIEVKPATATSNADDLLQRLTDQIETTEAAFRSLYFSKDPVRLDRILQRSRLATVLRFYFRRAVRYGLVTSAEQQAAMEEGLGRLEEGMSELKTLRWGFLVNARSGPQPPSRRGDVDVRFITRQDLANVALTARDAAAAPGGPSAPLRPARGSDGSGGPDPAPATPGPKGGAPPAAVHPAAGRQAPAAGPAPVQTSGDVAVELGSAVGSAVPVTWKAGVKGSPHLFVLGIPGQGKSWTLTRILGELARQHLPALVFDFHGQFADPSGPFAQAGHRVVLDAAQGLPFSPFEADVAETAGASFWRTNCFAVAEIFQYVVDLGDIQRDVVYEALRTCYEDVGFNEGSPRRLPTVDEFALRLSEYEERRGIKNVVPRCRPLLEFGLFRDAPGAESFDALLERGLVIDVHNLGLETLQLAAGAFVLRKVYKDMFRWGHADRLRLAIVLDEAHRLAKDITLPKIMKEGRKFGIAVIVASQGLADYHPDVVGNAGTKVVFRTNFPMSKKVAGFLRPLKNMDLAALIEQLDVGEAYVQTPVMNTCARVRMHPLATAEPEGGGA